MNKLLQNPFIKIIGIGLILYFGLFKDKENPEGLGKRLSSENVKKNFDQAKSQTHFIVTNLGRAKELEAQKKEEKQEQNSLEEKEQSSK